MGERSLSGGDVDKGDREGRTGTSDNVMLLYIAMICCQTTSERYWPDSKTEDAMFGNFTVHLISEKSLPDYQVRELRVTYATVRLG